MNLNGLKLVADLKLPRPLRILQTTTTTMKVVRRTPTTRVNSAIPGISRGCSSAPSSRIRFLSYFSTLKRRKNQWLAVLDLEDFSLLHYL